jgi:hypothetical protein
VVAPLRQYDNLTQEQWFAHGMLDYPPKDGDFMELESGANYTGKHWHAMVDRCAVC